LKTQHKVITVLLPEDFYVDIVSDQNAATPTELRAAGCLNSALDEVSIYLMKKGERREMINSYDAEAAREIIKRKTKKPHTNERGLTLINFSRTLRAWQKSLLQNQPLLPLG
jgi:hypothetical protein